MPVVLARLRPPRRPARHLRRPRLLDRLHQGLDSDLIAVVTPAGYGKTVLLAEFAREVPAAVCWYSAHPDDADLVNFVAYLERAIRSCVPSFAPRASAHPNGKGRDPRGLAAGFGIRVMVGVGVIVTVAAQAMATAPGPRRHRSGGAERRRPQRAWPRQSISLGG